MQLRLNLSLSILASVLLALPAAAQEPMDKGEYLARAGNCVVCHTVPGGQPFAGGLKMATPFGAIYTTNITPDPETGIGTYTFEDFDRALRLGVAKDGHHLYPAMPYPSYAKTTEEDSRALYEFFMKSVTPVRQENLASEIPWPLSMRWPLAVWNFFFFDSDRYTPKADRDDEWNRGAYLVQGLGHCGACHTPRGIGFQEKGLDETDSDFLIGANLDNWSATNLTGDMNTGLGRWSEDELLAFLKTGRNRHGTAFGTMIEVINYSTQYMTDADLRAMSKYLKSLSPSGDDSERVYAYDHRTTAELKARRLNKPGAGAYLLQCESCHAIDGRGRGSYLPALAGNPAVLDRDPVSLINIVLNGSARLVVEGLPDAYRMPQFRILMSDQEIADVVTFIRSSWGNEAERVTADKVGPLRKLTDPASDTVVVLRMR
jgi:alcohol dehydrogenase (quinone), cytochrome c subunit